MTTRVEEREGSGKISGGQAGGGKESPITAVIVVIGVIVLLDLAVLVFYFNRLVRYRNRVDTAWQQINVQLTRRHDLIPNLADIVKGYASHEGKVFVEVADARRRAAIAHGVGEHTTAEGAVNGSLDTLFMVAEKYPDLKANQEFLRFGEELSRTETRIAGARKYYNGAVMHYDNSRQGFPGNIVASLFSGRFPDREYFEIETPRAREVPEARM